MLLLLAVIALTNLLLYAALFLLARLAAGWLLGLIAGSPSQWARNTSAVALTTLAVFAAPLSLNQMHRHQRATEVRGDIAWAGSLTHTKTLAILTDEPEDHNWYDQKECGPLRCRALLYHHAVDAVLVALPPPIGTQLDPSTPVIRYRLDHRAWCPPIEHIDGRRNGRNLDQLAAAAAGDCLVSEPTTLGDADVILRDQTFAPRKLPFDTPVEGVIGERISIHTRDGENWRALYRDTAIGGADLAVPLYIGMPGRSSFGALLVGGPSIGFMTSRLIEPRRIDLAVVMAAHGLGRDDRTVPAADMPALARRLLADPAIPQASATMQFLASYPWLGGWRRDDLDTVAAIIRDQRVTNFPAVPWLEKDRETPAELAQPIIDRVMASDVSGTPSRTECGQHCAVRILAEVFSLLPPGAAAQEYDELLRLAQDRTRRPYVAAMFSRLADAGPRALAEFEHLIQDGLREGHAAEDKTAWALGDGCMVPVALYGLARLGEAAKPAKMTALTAAKDELAIVRELDKNAVWEIGQCGVVFPDSSNECRFATRR